jgi:hypothetical protein
MTLPSDKLELLVYCEQLQAKNERLRAALETVEWIAHEDDTVQCHWCGATYSGFHPSEWEHKPDCQRQAALGIDISAEHVDDIDTCAERPQIEDKEQGDENNS